MKEAIAKYFSSITQSPEVQIDEKKSRLAQFLRIVSGTFITPDLWFRLRLKNNTGPS